MTDRLSFEVIGFRQWEVDENLGLKSAYAQHVWPVGATTAKCERTDGPKPCKHAPGKDCHCGLYALHSPDAFWYGSDGKQGKFWITFGGGTPTYVAGLISAWGRLEVHHDGFRAEHAQIVAVALPGGKRDAAIARGVAGEYKVPLVPATELASMGSEYGSLVPEAMRPEKPEPKEDWWFGQYNNLLSQQYKQLQQYHYWQPTFTTISTHVMPQWAVTDPGSTVETATPGDGSVADEIRKLKAPINDPRRYLPKRKGGFR